MIVSHFWRCGGVRWSQSWRSFQTRRFTAKPKKIQSCIARKYRQNLNVAVLSSHSDVIACHVIVVVGLQRLSLVQLSNRSVVCVVLRVGDDSRLAVHASSPNPADTCHNTCCDEHYQCADDSSDESGLALVFLCSEEDQVSPEQCISCKTSQSKVTIGWVQWLVLSLCSDGNTILLLKKVHRTKNVPAASSMVEQYHWKMIKIIYEIL